MRHSIHVEEFGLRLRPVRLEDAGFIVWLRNLDHVRGRVGTSSTDVAHQKIWLNDYFERDGDYYFIAETPEGVPVGTHGIYNVGAGRGESGRYIVRSDALAGVPVSVMALDLAFGPLGLTCLHAQCVSTNLEVCSLHRKTGFRQVGIRPAAQMIDGKWVDLLQFVLMPQDWSKARAGQLPLAELAGRMVREWARSQSAAACPWARFSDPRGSALGLLASLGAESDLAEVLSFERDAVWRASADWIERVVELGPLLCFAGIG